MKSFKRAALYGFLLWLIPFAVSCFIFPLKQSGSPLFETIMPIVVVASGVVFVNLYFIRVGQAYLREALAVGVFWMIISLLLDLSLFMWGPMKMSFVTYMTDIGLAYLIFPILTVGVGHLPHRQTVRPVDSRNRNELLTTRVTT